MFKLNQFYLLVIISMVFATSCKNKSQQFSAEPPLPGFETSFVEISIDLQKDSTYLLENETKISITQGSILDSLGNIIKEPINLRFRQFDDALSIYLSGLPMKYNATSREMVLKTAGMFEIRANYKGSSIQIDSEKPIKVSIGSFFEDTRQGFFKMDDKTGDWALIDIPEAKYNNEKIILRKKLKTLKPKWIIPLPPNYYVVSLGRMADIYLRDDYKKIYKANMSALKSKMKKYGVGVFDVHVGWRNQIDYRGNKYDASEMLWKADRKVNVPKWAKETNAYDYNSKIMLVDFKKINSRFYQLTIVNPKENKIWTTKLELISHLRYLVKYSPEQLIAQADKIEQEIKETEAKIKSLRTIEYTVELYSMGIFNCDKPEIYRNGRPTLTLKLNGKNITNDEVHRIVAFNDDLSSYSTVLDNKTLKFAFFKGSNKMMLITKDGDVGLLTAKEFDKLDMIKIQNSKPLEVALTKVNAKDEEQLKELLLQ